MVAMRPRRGPIVQEFLGVGIELLQQASAPCQSIEGYLGRRRQRLDLEIRPVRVLEDAERVVFLAEKTASFASEGLAVHVEQPDGRGHRLGGGPKPGNGRSDAGIVI